MPVVTKQKPTAAPVVKNDSGSAWDLVGSIRMLLYGASGTGKTTLWATFPGPILALICSGGHKPGELRSINTPEYHEKIDPKTISSSEMFHKELEDSAKYATVVLDHASGFADMALSEILGKPVPAQKQWGLTTQQQYGQMSLLCKEAFRKLLNCNGNVVIVAQERIFGEESDSEIIKPTVGAALTPSLTGWLNPACDYVVQTYKRPKIVQIKTIVAGKEIMTSQRGRGVEYCLRTEPHDIYMTKFRIPRGQVLPECIVDPSYEKVLKLIQGG